MSLQLILPTLALDMDVIVGAIGVVIVVGSMIANWFKTQAEARKQQDTAEGKAGAPRDLDELAARRRAELQAQARAQRQGTAGTQAPGVGGSPGEPGNLTMAERIERARAKEAYRQRAEQMRSGGGSRQEGPAPAERPAAAQAKAQQAAAERRRRELAQAEEQRQRQLAEARRRHAQAEAEAQRGSSPPAARPGRQASSRTRGGRSTQASRRVATQGSVQTKAAASLYDLETAERQAKEKQGIAIEVAKPAPARAASEVIPPQGRLIRGRQLGILLSNQMTLRQAVILKEVFDRPLALRESVSKPV